MVLSSNTLYGTTYGQTYSGWSSGFGTIFAINTDGTGFTNLYSFTATFNPPPHLTVMISATNVVLTWPTNSYGGRGIYLLVSTTNLASQAGWTAVSPGPVLLNGQNTVTNSITGTQQFYSLAWGCLSNNDCNSDGSGLYTCVGGNSPVGTCSRR